MVLKSGVIAWAQVRNYVLHRSKIKHLLMHIDRRCERFYSDCPTVLFETDVGLQTGISSAQFSCVRISTIHCYRHCCILRIIETSGGCTWMSVGDQEGYEMEWCYSEDGSWSGELWSSCGWRVGGYSSCYEVAAGEVVQSVLMRGESFFLSFFCLSDLEYFCIFVKMFTACYPSINMIRSARFKGQSVEWRLGVQISFNYKDTSNCGIWISYGQLRWATYRAGRKRLITV